MIELLRLTGQRPINQPVICAAYDHKENQNALDRQRVRTRIVRKMSDTVVIRAETAERDDGKSVRNRVVKRHAADQQQNAAKYVQQDVDAEKIRRKGPHLRRGQITRNRMFDL